MACILAESALAERDYHLQPGNQYPEESLLRVHARYGVGQRDGVIFSVGSKGSPSGFLIVSPPSLGAGRFSGGGTLSYIDAHDTSWRNRKRTTKR